MPLTDSTYSDKTFQELPSVMISGATQQNQEHSTLSAAEVHASKTVWLTQNETDYTEKEVDYGGRCTDSSTKLSPESCFGKIPMGVDIPLKMTQSRPSAMFSGNLMRSGTLHNGQLSQHQKLAHLTSEKECSLLPTPMTMSKSADARYNRPGQDRLEMRLRVLGLITPGCVSNINLREWIMGTQQNSTKLEDWAGGELIPIKEKWKS